MHTPGIPALPLQGQQSNRILIIDDSVAQIRALGRILQDFGQLFFATSGQEGLALAKTVQPHLILLDVELPGKNGYEICRELKHDAITRDCAILFITSHSSAEHEVRALEAGAVDFLTKPLNPKLARARVTTHLVLKHQSDYLHSLVILDELTGVYNRRHFNQQLQLEWRRHGRQGSTLGLLIIDIDHFKLYNDHYGHVQGDACLRSVAQALSACTRRAGDGLARYGGEEFALLMADSSEDDALRQAQRLCQAIGKLELPHAASLTQPYVTVSVGAACLAPSESKTAQEIVELADEALYRAKQDGRNRAHLWRQADCESGYSLAGSSEKKAHDLKCG